LYNKNKSIYNNDRQEINTNTRMNLPRQTPCSKMLLEPRFKEKEEGLFTITEGREFQRGIMSIKNDDLWATLCSGKVSI